jgi:hypothetical protein
VDFLLECIGFPPEHPLEDLIERVRRDGESAPWRGPAEHHMRLALVDGLELRADRDPERGTWNLVPHYQTNRRLRVAVEEILDLPDSRFDALLTGWAAPPTPDELVLDEAGSANVIALSSGGVLVSQAPGAYPITMYLTDARRLPPHVPHGSVLAVSVAGFALDVAYVGADEGVRDAAILERESGAWIRPLDAPGEPGGCAEVSLRILSITHHENPITKLRFDRIEADAPERPHSLFVSRWQLEHDGLPPPRPGARIEGTFLFTGRIAGGLPGPRRTARGAFG